MATKTKPKKPKKKIVKTEPATTIRQQKFLSILLNSIENKDKFYLKDIALEAGFSESTALKYGTVLYKKFQENGSLKEALEKQGVDAPRIASKISDLMDATRVISANVIVKGGDGLEDAGTMTKDFIDVPDNMVQYYVTKLACDIRGDLKPAIGITVDIGDLLRRSEEAKEKARAIEAEWEVKNKEE